MARTRSPFARELVEGRRRLDAWRRRRSTRSMPEDLWRLAAELGSRHGVSPTARALGLGYAVLRRRVATSRPAFVEIAPATERPCRLEFEDGVGGKMRVDLPADAMAAVETLARLFLARRG